MEKLQLGDVQTTALIPLAIKANETKSKKPRIRDEKAVEIIDNLKIDTKPYDKFLSHEGVVARTILIDRAVKELIAGYPDASIVSLGCGFDDRFSRVDNGMISWYDVDLPDSIAARKKVYMERDRVNMIPGNALERDWTEKIPKDRVVIVIAEGFFMYFTKEETKRIIDNITESFPKGFLLAEMMGKFAAGDKGKHHDTVKSTNASFKWGTDSAEEFLELSDKLSLIREDSFNVEMQHFGIRCFLFAKLFWKFNNRLAQFCWPEKEDSNGS